MKDGEATSVELDLRVAPDALAVLVSGALPSNDPGPAIASLAERLKARGIVGTPPLDELTRLVCEAAAAGGEVKDLVVARGQAPGCSRDGQLIWAREFFATDFVEDATGAVDFWQRRGNPSIGDGEQIATLIEARRGPDGRDVFGTKLPAAAPVDVRLRAGTGVRAAPDAQNGHVDFFAAVDGRVRLASGVLSVDNVYTIKGNVGIETGHVVHRGAVVVNGDVESGARVVAGGDCEIRGTVQSALLEVGGDLIVRGGVLGRADVPIRIGGRLRAKFVMDAEVEAENGVLIESEIIHSTIRCRGPVEVPQGRIVACEVTALGGVTVRTAGGEGLSRTVIRAGVDHRWETEVAAREEQIAAREKAMTRIQHTVGPLLERDKALTPQQREAAAALRARAAEMEMAVTELRGAAEAFAADSRARANPRVLVLARAHTDTEFQVRDARLIMEQTREGPFRAKVVRGKLLLLPGERDAYGEESEPEATEPGGPVAT